MTYADAVILRQYVERTLEQSKHAHAARKVSIRCEIKGQLRHCNRHWQRHTENDDRERVHQYRAMVRAANSAARLRRLLWLAEPGGVYDRS